MALFGLQLGPKIDTLVGEYVKYYMPSVPQVGDSITRGDLEQRIKDAKDQCADYVHRKNWSINRANARNACSVPIDAAYRDIEDYSIASTYQQDQQVTQLALQGNKKLYGIVAVVLLTLLGIALLLKK